MSCERDELNALVAKAASEMGNRRKVMPLPRNACYYDTRAYKQRLRQAVADWIAKPFARFRNPVAFTVLIRKAAHGQSGFRVDEFEAQKILRRFWNGFNDTALRSVDYERKRRLPLIAFLETSASDRLHYHAVTDTPVELPKPLLEMVLTWEWEQCKLRVGEPDFPARITDSGWLDYMTKPQTKDPDDPTGGLDLFNYHPDRFDGPLRAKFLSSLSGFKEMMIWKETDPCLGPNAFEGFT